MKNKLTERSIKNIVIKTTPYEIIDTEISGFILRVQPTGLLTYYLVYRTNNGTKKRYKLGRHGSITLVQAREIAKKLLAKVLLGQDLQEEKKRSLREKEKAQAQTLEKFIKMHYAPWVKAERKSGLETTKMLYCQFPHFMHLPLIEINPLLVEKWRVAQLNKGKKASTINRNVTAIKAVLSKAVTWGYLEQSPLIKLKPIKTDNMMKVRYLSLDEENRLLTTLQERDKNLILKRISANRWRSVRNYNLLPILDKENFFDHLTPMVLIAMNTGLRQGELFSLRWDYVDLDKAMITVAGEKAKNGKTRHIPLNTIALSAMITWKNQCLKNDLVFSNKKGRQMDNVRKSWGRVLKKSNITNFRWHDLRHHFASKLVMAGVDLNTVRELLGHSDIAVTLRYAHLAPEHKAEAVQKLV